MKIAIIDYGMGNIHSVQKALQFFGSQTLVTNIIRELEEADKLVLPGVGAFSDAMSELKKRGLVTVIKEQIKKKKPFLGICLGMQLLFEKSEEASDTQGLGVLKGTVVKFLATSDLRVPHMGWNQLNPAKNDCPLLKDIGQGASVYFCHSYYPSPDQEQDIAAYTDYGINFASVVWKENIYATQFHPEKSQNVGLKIMENFVKSC